MGSCKVSQVSKFQSFKTTHHGGTETRRNWISFESGRYGSAFHRRAQKNGGQRNERGHRNGRGGRSGRGQRQSNNMSAGGAGIVKPRTAVLGNRIPRNASPVGAALVPVQTRTSQP